MIYGLSTLWSGAVAGSSVMYHGTAITLAIGWSVSVGMAAFVIGLVLRKHNRQEIRNLLEGTGYMEPLKKHHRWAGFILAAVAGALALAIILTSALSGNGSGVESFFCAGFYF